MSQGQFGHFMCHLTVLEAGDDGKVRLENETSSEAKCVRNFISGPSKKCNFKLEPNKKFSHYYWRNSRSLASIEEGDKNSMQVRVSVKLSNQCNETFVAALGYIIGRSICFGFRPKCQFVS